MDPMKWADKVSKKQYKKTPKEEREVDPDTGLPKADVHAHRTLKPEDLSYDFLAKMGFVPPPPPPPWGFNKEGDSTAEIEERVMRQLIPIADLPTTMMCDACGAISLQLVNKLKKADRINEKRFRVGKKLGEYELLAALDEMCEGKFAIDRDAEGEVPPADWDEYGVADLNETCASPPVISCWNSTKRLVGPGCAKAYEYRREKEVRFGWLTTRIKPECERLISEYGVRNPSPSLAPTPRLYRVPGMTAGAGAGRGDGAVRAGAQAGVQRHEGREEALQEGLQARGQGAGRGGAAQVRRGLCRVGEAAGVDQGAGCAAPHHQLPSVSDECV